MKYKFSADQKRTMHLILGHLSEELASDEEKKTKIIKPETREARKKLARLRNKFTENSTDISLNRRQAATVKVLAKAGERVAKEDVTKAFLETISETIDSQQEAYHK